MVDLDSRARDAAAGLRSAADRRVRPAWEPPGPRRGMPPRPVLAVAAALVVVAIVAAAGLVLRTGDGDDELIPTEAGGVPVLIPDAVPDGLTALGAKDLPPAPEEIDAERISTAVFGDAAADDPFAGGELGVTMLHGSGGDPVGESPITVRGHAGWTTVVPTTGRVFVTWEEAPDVLVAVNSATFARADLVDVAEGLTFDAGHTRFDATVLPPGMSLVGSLDDAAFTGARAPALLPDATSGHLVGYRGVVDGRLRSLTVAVLSVDPDEELAVRWGLGEPAGEAEVRGHPGVLGSQPADGADDAVLSVMWEEQPGVFCVVAGDVERSDLLAAAESLRPASEQEWADLKALGPTVAPEG
jgi:hypothetical protein